MAEGSRVLTLRLALRAIRWRAAASAAVFSVAVVAILAATVGPIYLHAVDQVVLTRHLTGASRSQRDVMISRQTEIGYPNTDWHVQVQKLAQELTGDHLFARPVQEQQIDVDYGGAELLKSEVASISGLCAHVHIVHGRCPSGDSINDTLISTNTAAADHLRVGGTLAATTTAGTVLHLSVVGVYRPVAPNGPFWAPWFLFQAGQAGSPNEPAPGDASFVTSAAITSRSHRELQTVSANVPLLPGAVTYDDIGGLRATLAHVNATVAQLASRAAITGTTTSTVTTSLPVILNQTEHETSLARTLVTIATIQLALLAILLLYAVVANTATAQGPEVALAKLRGRRGASVLTQSIAQPVVLVIAAAPVAAFLAWLLVRVFATDLLGQSADVVFPAPAYGVAALAVVGGVLAAIVAAHRVVVTPVGELMRTDAGGMGSTTGLLVADAAAVTIAVGGLVELKAGGVLNSGKPNPLSVLTPTLLAIGAAVVVLRLLPFVGRRLARWTRDSSRLATFLAIRQLLRRPAEARAVLLVAVAVSIASFAVTLWSESGHNRSLRALNTAGANTVLDVRLGHRVNLRAAVDRSDPTGNSMAVAYSSSDQLPPLIAVDTARFAKVGAWVARNSSTPLPTVLARLSASARPVTVRGAQLRLRVDLGTHPGQAIRLQVKLNQPNHLQVMRTVKPIQPGRGVYDISLPPACRQGCQIASLGLTAGAPESLDPAATGIRAIDATLSAAVRVTGRWRPVPGFTQRARWRGNGAGPVEIKSTGERLSVDFQQEPDSVWPQIVSASIPDPVPAVIASAQAAAEQGGQIPHVEAVGLDRQALFVNGVSRSITLPQVGRAGIMVSLANALAVMRYPTAGSTHYQVWLSASAPVDMAARLARQHVYVQRTVRASTYRTALDHSGPAFADSLFLFSALAATLLAIGATAAGRVLSIRRRGYELAALEAVGVSPRALRRATAAEQGAVFAVGLIAGLVAGLVGSQLALPSTPVFVNPAAGPPLTLGLPWALLAIVAAGMIVVFVLVSVAIARVVERVATPTQLRGAQQ